MSEEPSMGPEKEGEAGEEACDLVSSLMQLPSQEQGPLHPTSIAPTFHQRQDR